MNELEAFRVVARQADMPDDAIDWWLRLARPCLNLEKGGSGPVVGYFGGRPALPASVAWPERTVHLASIDLAAIPRDAHDLDLPSDGTLVFFSETAMLPEAAHVIYVPAGTAVAEAEPAPTTPSVYERFPLRGTPDWSLPEWPGDSPLYAGEDRDDEELYQEIVWDLEVDDDDDDDDGGCGGQSVAVLGGYGTSNTGGLGVPVDFETQVLLVEFYLTEDKVGTDFETDYSTLFYTLSRDDLAARRFEKLSFAADFHG
ncbi:DUF1963 domain-containing protein [Micromonospora okii]|uniref:DUF1963 domain-containing protein n=1 Tax=Micromonospora okii TaxID=1182970 RepID=UPI001E4714B9|nr:DUF1963 domain-containing protein [Micromonospora okii]